MEAQRQNNHAPATLDGEHSAPLTEQALLDTQARGARFEPKDFGELERLAERAFRSGLFAVKSAEAALVIMLTGASLGLPPIVALRSIHVVEGKPVLSSDIIAAVILRSGLAARWQVMETTAKRCVIETDRRGQPGVRRHEWTWEMAQTARLAGKGNWSAYPAAMLRARCTAELGRMVFPDVLAGVYVEGEIGAEAEPAVPRIDPRPEEPALPSVAYAEWLAELSHAETLPDVRAAYGALADNLRAAGEDPAERLSEASRAVTERVAALGYRVTSAELREMLAPTLAGGRLCAYAELIHALEPTATNAAHWWRSQRASIPAEAQDTVKRLLARRIASTPDAAGTRAAGLALKAALAALDSPEPPPRGGAPVPVAPESTTASATREPGDDSEAEAALAGWETTAEGREAHAATLPHPRAVLASARRHCTLPGYARILAARLVALGGTDAQGTTLSEESALATVNGAMAQAQRDRRAARDAAARRAA